MATTSRQRPCATVDIDIDIDLADAEAAKDRYPHDVPDLLSRS